MTSDELQARTDAVRALEAQFGELINRMRRHLNENAQRVSPGMLPGAYKVFSTIAGRGARPAGADPDRDSPRLAAR